MSNPDISQLTDDDQSRIRMAHEDLKKARGKDAARKTAEVVRILEQYQGMSAKERKQFVEAWARSR